MKSTDTTHSYKGRLFRLHRAETAAEIERSGNCEGCAFAGDSDGCFNTPRVSGCCDTEEGRTEGIWLEEAVEKPWLPDDEPGWIEWAGGESPVPAGTMVEFVMRNERNERIHWSGSWDSTALRWKHEGKGGDIVAYRVAKTKVYPDAAAAVAEGPHPPFAVLRVESKETNPKDAMGIKKAPLSCVPMNVVAEIGLGMMEGALKYGRHNFRAVGVRASVYFDAVQRHLIAWWEGEDIDPDSGVHHIAKALACLSVLRDAQHQGLCTDDRPPSSKPFYSELNDLAEQLLAKHADKAPRHYTIKDARP